LAAARVDPAPGGRVTRATVIVSLWLLLTGGIGDAVLQGERSPLGLLAFYFAISILTALALWLQFKGDAPRAGSRRRRERFYHYD
jgi:hypothetical protein